MAHNGHTTEYGNGPRLYPTPLMEEVDALKARIEALETALRNLIIRVDMNGGIGEYKGGPAFVMKRARELLP